MDKIYLTCGDQAADGSVANGVGLCYAHGWKPVYISPAVLPADPPEQIEQVIWIKCPNCDWHFQVDKEGNYAGS